MSKHYTQEQINEAREIDLADFVSRTFPDITTCDRYGNVRFIKGYNHSLVISSGAPYYHDFGDDTKGGSIELLQLMDYSFQEAMELLTEYVNSTDYTPVETFVEPIRPVEKEINKIPAAGNIERVKAYLMSRGISNETIEMLHKERLLWETAEHHNVMYLSKNRDYYELRGTYKSSTKKQAFKGKDFTLKTNYWSFGNKGVSLLSAEAVFICESATDAVSLYEMHRRNIIHAPSKACFYVSIGGCANYETVELLIENVCKNHHPFDDTTVYIALDDDAAGRAATERLLKTGQAIIDAYPKEQEDEWICGLAEYYKAYDGYCDDWNELLLYKTRMER